MTQPLSSSWAAALVPAADHLELERLIVELAHRIDHGAADTAWELFTDDGSMALGAATMADRAAIEAWGRERSRPGRTTRHVLGNSRFVAAGPDEAEGTTVFTVHLHDGEGRGGPVPAAVGEYSDRYRRVDGAWRFVRRDTTVLFAGDGL